MEGHCLRRKRSNDNGEGLGDLRFVFLKIGCFEISMCLQCFGF